MNAVTGFSPLVSAAWLEQHLAEVVVLDGSYYLATMGKDAEAEYCARRIAGALRWDIDAIATPDDHLKHMMPSASTIAAAAGERGISRDTTVVVYDQLGVFSAARVWLTLKTIGHENVALLDGGLPAWSGPTESGELNQAPVSVDYGDYSAHDSTVDRDAVAEVLSSGTAVVLDARAAARFYGEAAEPVAGLRSGHMPGALSLPYTSLLTADNQFKPIDELREVFAQAGAELERPVVTTCGSGVTAAIITFALELLGKPSKVYDGSWSDWGRTELNMPVTCDK